MLEINNLIKNYGNEKVLKGIDLNIKNGEVISIIGKSGSGKSTLLKCINRLEHIDSGEIILNDKNINDYDLIDLRKQVGIVFQEFNLFEHLTVLENITIALEKVKQLSNKESRKIAKQLLSDMGLVEKESRYPNELSGGQKQRVAIIRTLAMQPSIILLDEPTSALDQEMKYEVLELIKRISKSKITLIIVTHEVEFARKISDRIITLEKGKIKRQENV
ncbi:MAG: amino acid ABC transporter ATP-binding protein [Bacilli bacterium]|nr:amino acid ABC transporter ATP-binding protein [Bacilli bacterium]MDD4734252.1 amino acid ABC transporter ATP-binding protein [Bacilli bacterium]